MDNYDFDIPEDAPLGAIFAKPGRKPNTMLTIMPDLVSDGFFAVVWQFPPMEDSPIGTIRPFETIEKAASWLLLAEAEL